MMRDAAGSLTVSVPVWPSVEPGWKGRVNNWLLRYPHVEFPLGARRLGLRWTARPVDALPLTLHLECAGHALRVCLSGLDAIDARLVGEPFTGMPRSLRNLVIERLLGECIAELPLSLAQGIQLKGIEWADEDMPRPMPDGLPALAFECRGSASDAVSAGVIRFADVAVLDWVLDRFEAVAVRTLDGKRLAARASLVVGHSSIRAEELAQLEVGSFVWMDDAVVERAGIRAQLGIAASEGQPHPVQAQVFIKQRRVTLTAAVHAAVAHAVSARESGMNIDVSKLELQVDFGLGDIMLPLGEIERLGPGYVFELPQDVADSEVRICVAGKLLALGEIVAVGRRLGVRVTRLGDAQAAAEDE